MDKKAAYIAMINGSHVTHRYLKPEVWLEMNYGIVTLHHGDKKETIESFLNDFSASYWNEGWELKSE